MILETTFLVDLEREISRSVSGPAQEFLESHADEQLFITLTIAGELAGGPRVEHRDSWEELLSLFRILSSNLDVCWEYGRASRFLRENGLLIGTNDLWIAAAGLAYGQPVVTRNVRHFSRIPGLTVQTY